MNQVPNEQTYQRLPILDQLTTIRGDLHQPRGGETSDEQGQLVAKIQDAHFTSLCGTHRSHRKLTFPVCINTTTIQTQKNIIYKRIAHLFHKRIIHSSIFIRIAHSFHKRIAHSFHKRIVHSLIFKCIAHSFHKRIAHSFHKTHCTFIDF